MKLCRISLVFLILFLSIGYGSVLVKRIGKRDLRTESYALQLEYLGSCKQFEEIRPSIKVSSFKNGNCLPIINGTGSSDANDLNTHAFCTDSDRGKSEITFTDAFHADQDITVSKFILSFIPNRPFKSLNGFSYLRRPSCSASDRYCHNCESNDVLFDNHYVISKDLIYIIPPHSNINTCKKSDGSCCEYIDYEKFCPNNPRRIIMSIHGNNHDNDQHPNHN
eukprot:TRINITY_DN5654_c0_g1_i1.p1 TRINITY_DN5654_c0_g1~~TRINITY_DN5654_c0_g1_i1.p1  ORF type:complete len:222 (+),score=18.35 TRINITY_DN5654_c0_g1_i1:27-692(+)